MQGGHASEGQEGRGGRAEGSRETYGRKREVKCSSDVERDAKKYVIRFSNENP